MPKPSMHARGMGVWGCGKGLGMGHGGMGAGLGGVNSRTPGNANEAALFPRQDGVSGHLWELLPNPWGWRRWGPSGAKWG
jgi:hypothetical protein